MDGPSEDQVIFQQTFIVFSLSLSLCLSLSLSAQANYGGICVKLPKTLKAIYSDDDHGGGGGEGEEGGESEGWGSEGGGGEGDGGDPEVEMNWNICNYLSEAGSCQDIFRVKLVCTARNTSQTSIALSAAGSCCWPCACSVYA